MATNLFHEWIYIIDSYGFEIWKSNHREQRLHYCGFISFFDEPNVAELKLEIAEMFADFIAMSDYKTLPTSFM